MSQTRKFGYSFNDSSQCAGGARSANTQEPTRQQDVHKIWGLRLQKLDRYAMKKTQQEASELFTD